jgi:hypothetical protein
LSERPVISSMAGLPVIPKTIGDMRHNQTGLWRYLTPRIKDQAAPCQNACPLGMPSPDFINDLIQKDASAALGRIMDYNPLPGITGRLCYHPCQSKCLRKGLDQSVQIQKLECFAANAAPPPPNQAARAPDMQVVVLGAGPLGLSTAFFLGRAGVAASVLDPHERAGGFLIGVDKAKLPAEVLSRETSRLADYAGITLHTGLDSDSLNAAAGSQAWKLAIYDQTAHGGESACGIELTRLAERLPAELPILDSSGVSPADGYKPSQAAPAVAAGRTLAIEALISLGLVEKVGALKVQAAEAKAQNPINPADMHYEFFKEKNSAIAQAKDGVISGGQALAEAERCLSCGHCNLCGRCRFFARMSRSAWPGRRQSRSG